MWAVSSGPSAMRIFTTHAKESRTEPTATALTKALRGAGDPPAPRRPKMPFTRKPSSGNAGMSQRCCILELHRVHVVDVQRVAVLEYRKDDRQAHGGFGSRDY